MRCRRESSRKAMDITPLVPVGRQIIQAYGDGGFRIAGVRYEGSVIVFPDHTELWPVTSCDEVTGLPSLLGKTEFDILLLGTGQRRRPVPLSLRRLHGFAVEVMDTGAACRTFNVLLAEERRMAALLIAVP